MPNGRVERVTLMCHQSFFFWTRDSPPLSNQLITDLTIARCRSKARPGPMSKKPIAISGGCMEMVGGWWEVCVCMYVRACVWVCGCMELVGPKKGE